MEQLFAVKVLGLAVAAGLGFGLFSAYSGRATPAAEQDRAVAPPPRVEPVEFVIRQAGPAREQRARDPGTELASARPARNRPRASSVYYSGCNEVRAAGAAPLYAGDPGYRIGMDGDRDGIACEPYRGR